MSKVVLVHPDLQLSKRENSLLTSFAPGVKIINYTEDMSVDEVMAAINAPTVSHVAFIYHHPGSDKLPFFNEPIFVGDLLHVDKRRYFTDAAIDFIKRVRDDKSSGSSLIVDVLSCNLSSEDYKKEVAELETELTVNIRYSTDETGNQANGGNWVMESELPNIVNVRTTYFTDAVLKWKGVLNSNIANLIKAGGAFARYIQWNAATKTYLLRENIVWTQFVASTGILVTDFMSLATGETFNGNNKTIDFTGVTNAKGIFFGLANTNPRPWVKALGAIGGTSLATNAGYLIRDSSYNVYLENCYNTGIVNGVNGGGIAGHKFCSDWAVSVMNGCWNTGAITATGAGGLVGAAANSSGPNTKTNISGRLITMTNCYNTGAILGDYAGGIFGTNGALNGGQLDITGCYNSGTISGNYAGGITGSAAAVNGLVFIKKSYNTGAITGVGGAGIVGAFTFNGGNGLITITNCYNTGSVTSSSAAGFIGQTAGSSSTGGDITVSKCYNAGTLVTATSVGFIGPNAYTTGTGSITISDSVANGAMVGLNSNNVTLTNNSIDLATINGSIAASWDPSIWSVGGPVTVAASGDTANYLLPILTLFQSAPWGANIADPRYYSNATGTPAIYLTVVTVLVNFDVNTDASGIINIFSQNNPSITEHVIATVNLPASVLYNAPGNSLIKFQGIDDAIVAVRDDTFTTTETQIRTAIHTVITSPLNAMDAPPFNITNNGNRVYNNEAYYIYPSFGELALGAYAHYIFGHVDATAAIDNDTTFINKMNGISTGDAQIPNSLATQIKSIGNDKCLTLVKQVLSQDATRAMNVDNDASAPNSWQSLEFKANDVIYFSVKLKTPTLSVSGGASFVNPIVTAANYIETPYFIRCILG